MNGSETSDLARRVLKLEQDNGELKGRVLVLETRILSDLEVLRASGAATNTDIRKLQRSILGDGLITGLITRLDRVEQTNAQLRWIVGATLLTALSTLARMFFI
jgi:hypothetical protein